MSVTRGLLTSGSPFPCGKTSAAGFVPLNFPFIGLHQRRRTAGHPRSPARRHPAFRSSPGGLRRRASVGRQSVSCFHTQPVGDTHGSLFTPTFPALRAAVPVLRPVPRLPPAYFYNAIFPFITKIVRPGRFTFYCFHQRGAPQDTREARHADTLRSVPVRAAMPVLRPVLRLPPLPLIIRPFIEIICHL